MSRGSRGNSTKTNGSLRANSKAFKPSFTPTKEPTISTKSQDSKKREDDEFLDLQIDVDKQVNDFTAEVLSANDASPKSFNYSNNEAEAVERDDKGEIVMNIFAPLEERKQ